MGKNREVISETLNDSQKELLAKYDDAVNEMYAEIEKDAFIYGFRLGGRIVSDTFRNDIYLNIILKSTQQYRMR